LWRAGENLKILIGATVKSCPAKEPNFTQFLEGMVAAETDPERKQIIIKNARKADIPLSGIRALSTASSTTTTQITVTPSGVA
jgi:hypothetical protein